MASALDFLEAAFRVSAEDDNVASYRARLARDAAKLEKLACRLPLREWRRL